MPVVFFWPILAMHIWKDWAKHTRRFFISPSMEIRSSAEIIRMPKRRRK